MFTDMGTICFISVKKILVSILETCFKSAFSFLNIKLVLLCTLALSQVCFYHVKINAVFYRGPSIIQFPVLSCET
jgi:hypothetical protein